MRTTTLKRSAARPPARTRLALTLVLALALALGACGGDDDDDGATAVKVDTARLQAVERLTPEQFRALERVYQATVALEESGDSPNATQAQVDAALRPTLAVCDDLDAGHPLLSVQRASCPVAAALYRASFGVGACDGDEGCLEAAEAAVAALRDVVDISRLGDRAVRATRLDGACKRALVMPRVGYEFYAKFDRALERLVIALDAGSDDDKVDATLGLSQLDQRGLPSARTLLRRFRAGCR